MRVLRSVMVVVCVLSVSSCATVFKRSYQTVSVDQVPPAGVVVEGSGDVEFWHINSKTLVTHVAGVTDTLWIPPAKNSFVTSITPRGKSFTVNIYCSCYLKDTFRRWSTGDAYLEPECLGKKKPQPKKVIIGTEISVLWAVFNVPIVGHVVDHLSGALYDFKPLMVAGVCTGSVPGSQRQRTPPPRSSNQPSQRTPPAAAPAAPSS